MASSSDRFSFSAMKSNSSPPQILEDEKEREEREKERSERVGARREGERQRRKRGQWRERGLKEKGETDSSREVKTGRANKT